MMCNTCKGEGFIDLGIEARLCADCQGTGRAKGKQPTSVLGQWLERVLTPEEREDLILAMGALHRAKTVNRRRGRPSTPREIIALAHKLGLHFSHRARLQSAEAAA